MSEWISVKDRLPEPDKHVLVCCEVRKAHTHETLYQYICEGYYAAPHSIPAGTYSDLNDEFDYDEEEDEYYLREGWYEAIHNWDEYSGVAIADFVTHWMPMPEPPKEDDDAG